MTNKKTNWDVDFTQPPSSWRSTILGGVFQLSLVSAWVGGAATPFLAAYFGFKGKKNIFVFLGVTTLLGEIWPKRWSWSKTLNDYVMQYFCAPFKSYTVKVRMVESIVESCICKDPRTPNCLSLSTWGGVCGRGAEQARVQGHRGSAVPLQERAEGHTEDACVRPPGPRARPGPGQWPSMDVDLVRPRMSILEQIRTNIKTVRIYNRRSTILDRFYKLM